MILREHSCLSDVPLFLLHAECQLVASVEVYPLFFPTEVEPLLILCVNQTFSSPTSSKASRDCRQSAVCQNLEKRLLVTGSMPSVGRSQNSPEDRLQIKSSATLSLSISTEMQSPEDLTACIQQVQQDTQVHARHGVLQFMTWPN